MTGPVPSKVGTLAWFARRPVLWPQAARIVRQRLAPNRDAPKHELAAVAWCAERVISRDAALGQLGLARHHLSFDECMADLYLRALDRSRACPLSMGGPGDLTLLFSCAEGLAAERVLETGVAYGWSALPLLASLQARPGAVLHSVDMPYVEQNNDPYVGIVVPPELRRQWVLHRMADRRGIRARSTNSVVRSTFVITTLTRATTAGAGRIPCSGTRCDRVESSFRTTSATT